MDNTLHEISTFKVDQRIRKCVMDIKDQVLISKLGSACDLIAQEAKYHTNCLSNLYNKARAFHNKLKQNTQCSNSSSIAFAELISYLNDSSAESKKQSFRLADIVKLYRERLNQLGDNGLHPIHSTDLKDRILRHLPDMHAYNKGRDVFLAFSEHVGALLLDDFIEDKDDLSLMMVTTANNIRRKVFSNVNSFSGSFDQDSQVCSVPQSLLSLVNMIINGSNIKDQKHNKNISQPVLTIAQLISFNCVKKRKSDDSSKVYHVKDRQTPLPLYVGLKVHSLSRERGLIDSLYALGLSVSYCNVMDTITSMGNNVSQYYNEIGVVCPPQLRTGLFVTAAADNIDFNPSSSTSVGSFHGTGLSLFQNRGESDVSMMTNNSFNTHIEITKGQRHIGDLPDTYTNIKPTKLPTGDIFAPSVSDMCISKLSSNNESIIEPECEITADEFSWLRHVELSKMDEVTKDATLSWSAYHASRFYVTQILPSINAIIPLFSEEATSPAMLRHSMDIVNAAVQHINPGQTPVITVDQPLFAKIKQIQWSMPSDYGEDKFVIMLGGFHIELTLFKTLGS